MPKAAVKVEFKARDHLTPALKRMGAASGVFTGKLTRGFRKATRQASMFRSVFGGMLMANAFARGAALAGTAVRELGAEFLDFDKSITKAVSKLSDPNTGKPLSRGSKEFAKFSALARKEAAATEFTAGQTAQALENLAMAGFNVKQSMGALPLVLQLATNADVDVARATNIATKTLGAFGQLADDAATRTKNLADVNDVFAMTVSNASLDLEMMFETLKFVGPNALAAGQKVKDMAALVGVLAKRGIDASTAGTQLRMALSRLADPPPKAQKALNALGIQIEDDKGNYRNFIKIIEDLESATAGMGTRTKTRHLKQIFDVRAMTSINALIGEGSESIKEFRKEFEKMGGVSDAMAENIRQSLTVKLLRLKSVAVELGFKFFEAFDGKAGAGVDSLIEKVQKFDPKPVVQGLKDIAFWAEKVWESSEPLRENWKALTVAFAGFKALGMAKVLHGLVTSMSGLGAIMLGVSSIAGLLTFVIWGLIAAGVILVSRWDDVWNGFAEGIARTIRWVAELKKEFWGLVKDFQSTGFGETLLGGVIGVDPKDIDKFIQGNQKTIDDNTKMINHFEDLATDPSKDPGPLSTALMDQIMGFGRAGKNPALTEKIERNAAASKQALSFNPILSGIPKLQNAKDPAITMLNTARYIEKNNKALAAIDAMVGGAHSVESPSKAKAALQTVELYANIGFENAPQGMAVNSSSVSGPGKVDYSGLGDNE